MNTFHIQCGLGRLIRTNLLAAVAIVLCNWQVAAAQVVIDMPAPRKVPETKAVDAQPELEPGDLALRRYAASRTAPYYTYGPYRSTYRYPYNYGYYGYPFFFGAPLFIHGHHHHHGGHGKLHGSPFCPPGLRIRALLH